jgi:hypothetical protein
MKTLIERLAVIQQELHAPKGQRNTFGNYNYRSCEDILTSVKPLLNGLVLTINDDIFSVLDRVYVKATVTLTDGEHSLSNTAYARESVVKKGMDESQITGATSSYARKYALNGLLMIDDNKDADTMDNRPTVNEKGVKLTTKDYPEASKSLGEAAKDSLTPEQRNMANLDSTAIIDAFAIDAAMAHDEYELIKNSHKGEVEYLTAVWGGLDSKIRSSIKETGKARDIQGQA